MHYCYISTDLQLKKTIKPTRRSIDIKKEGVSWILRDRSTVLAPTTQAFLHTMAVDLVDNKVLGEYTAVSNDDKGEMVLTFNEPREVYLYGFDLCEEDKSFVSNETLKKLGVVSAELTGEVWYKKGLKPTSIHKLTIKKINLKIIDDSRKYTNNSYVIIDADYSLKEDNLMDAKLQEVYNTLTTSFDVGECYSALQTLRVGELQKLQEMLGCKSTEKRNARVERIINATVRARRSSYIIRQKEMK